MRISTRILIGYFLVVGIAAWFVLNVFQQEIKPGVRQALEDSLVDSANLLAELAADDVAAGTLNQGRFAAAVDAYRARKIDALISEHRKQTLDMRVYITDPAGTVIFDSRGEAVGQDYSRWNDVYLTLQGRYGARSSPGAAGDAEDSVMHVAAPVRDKRGALIGVLTVSRPNRTVAPIVARSEARIRRAGYLLLAISALIGGLFTWRLTRAIGRLQRYAEDVTAGRPATPPESGNTEIAALGRALDSMREELEGKQYVERYVQHLTHELKSPLAAIRAAAELLDEDMETAQRARFLGNIRSQCGRLQDIADRMLDLATLEQRQRIETPERLSLAQLARHALEAAAPGLAARHLTMDTAIDTDAQVLGERFLLLRALANLLDNAIAFSPEGGHLQLALCIDGAMARLRLRDPGPGVPDYAQTRIFERFYSLPRPDGGPRSTGLGLPFVAQVAALHGGTVQLDNAADGGAIATLSLPIAP
jgi:two-component system sensor histidine kinase CreC